MRILNRPVLPSRGILTRRQVAEQHESSLSRLEPASRLVAGAEGLCVWWRMGVGGCGFLLVGCEPVPCAGCSGDLVAAVGLHLMMRTAYAYEVVEFGLATGGHRNDVIDLQASPAVAAGHATRRIPLLQRGPHA